MTSKRAISSLIGITPLPDTTQGGHADWATKDIKNYIFMWIFLSENVRI